MARLSVKTPDSIYRLNDMHNQDHAHKHKPWYREPLVWLVIALPAAAVIAGISTVFIANNSSDSLVVDGFQKVGLIAQRESAADRKAMAMGLVAIVSIDRESGQLTARMETAKDAGFDSRKITVSLHHPTRRDMDRYTTLELDSSGLYRGNIGDTADGRWYIQLEGQASDQADNGGANIDKWRLSGRIDARQELVTLGKLGKGA